MDNSRISYGMLIWRGIVDENTIFRLCISLCPAIAVTSNCRSGALMGVAVLFVQIMVNVTIAAMKKMIHPRIRLPIYMLVISTWVTVIDMSMAAFAPGTYKEMGLYVQLIVAFASILAGAELFASKNGVVEAFFDGIGRGSGFLLALLAISVVRETLGKGAIFGITLLGVKPLLIMILPAGGFFAVGLLIAGYNYLDMRRSKRVPR